MLDLRDAVDAKERQMLDHKDRIREHERARRDLEEKMLAMEKSLVYASERVTALGQDKDRAVERERALKVRLDDSHIELAKTQDEIESLRKRLATAEDRSRAEIDKIRQDLENHVADMEQVHRAELAQLGTSGKPPRQPARSRYGQRRRAWRWTMPRSWSSAAPRGGRGRGHGRPPRRRVDPDAARTGKGCRRAQGRVVSPACGRAPGP